MSNLETINTIDRDTPNASQPDNILIPLMEHQLKLLYKCLTLENNEITVYQSNDNISYFTTKLGVICDSVGSGKSLVILSLLSNKLKNVNTHDIIVYTDDLINISTLNIINSNSKYIDTNILVIPHNIFLQWKGYITTQTSITCEYINTHKSISNCKFDKQLILVSATMYKKFSVHVNEQLYIVNRVIYDEADSIALTACNKIKSLFYWFISSSINNLLYPTGIYANYNRVTGRYDMAIYGIERTGFIKNTFKSLYQSKYSYIKKYLFLKNDDEFIKLSYNLPSINYILINCKNNNLLNVLNDIVSIDIQRMICAGDINEAIKNIDIEKTNNDNIIKIICNNLYDDINNKELELNFIKNKIYKNKELQIEHIKKIELKIKEIESKIFNIKERIKDNNIDPITLCEIEKPIIVKCCNNVFDFESIITYISNTVNTKCPICRAPITKQNIIIISEEEEEEEFKEDETKDEEEYVYKEHDKYENLNYILKQLPINSKIIIFSEYDGTYTNIINILNDNNINSTQLKGTATSITKIINNYNKSTNKTVLFLNAKYYGAGLNLEKTTHIISFHKMNIELENQIIGRAQRPGRLSQLNVYKLYYDNEN